MFVEHGAKVACVGVSLAVTNVGVAFEHGLPQCGGVLSLLAFSDQVADELARCGE